MMTVIRASDKNFQDFLFLQLASLIGIVKQHIRNYLDDIFEMIKEFWTPDSPLQSTIILLGRFEYFKDFCSKIKGNFFR